MLLFVVVVVDVVGVVAVAGRGIAEGVVIG